MDFNRPVHIDSLTLEQGKEIQNLLNVSGYTLELVVDGIVGAKTKKAFWKYKTLMYLGSPNYIGPTTYNRLLETQNPKAGRRMTPEGIEILKHFEGFRKDAYMCPANVPTIGYGQTYYSNGSPVKMGDTITETTAERELNHLLHTFSTQVDKEIICPLTPNQFSALVLLAYNIGMGDASRLIPGFAYSTIKEKLNRRDYVGASEEFERWNKAGGKVVAGLVRRRKAERNLFLSEKL